MGNFLHAVGRFGFRHPWRVIAVWIVILIGVIVAATLNYKAPSSAISIPGTKAQTALTELNTLFPDAGRGTARIVYAAPTGQTLSRYKQAIISSSDQIASVKGVASATSPYVNTAAMSSSGTIAYTQVQLTQAGGAVSKKTIADVTKIVSQTRRNGLKVEMGGDIINQAPGEIIGVGEIGGVVLALIVLVLTLGSLVAAGFPLIVALLTIATSMGGLFGLSKLVDITSTTPVLAVMLGLAVGIDYSLFIISKYRHYLLEGDGYESAASRSIATAGNAVLFAATTVVIALASLTIAGIPFMSTMGLTGAATIALAALVAVTIIPSLLRLAGVKIFRSKTRARIAAAQKDGFKEISKAKKTTIWYRWGHALTAHPIIYGAAGIIVLVIIALPVRSLTLGLPTDQHSPVNSTQKKAYDLLAQGFGPGFNAPLAVVVQHVQPVTPQETAAVRSNLMSQFSHSSQPLSSAHKQTELAKLTMATNQLAIRLHLQTIANQIAKRSDVKSVQVGLASKDGTNGVLQVIPASAPGDTATDKLIKALRSPEQQKTWSNNTAVTYGVTGSTALQADINDKLAAALPLYLAVVVGLSLVLLLIAFRSILIPIKATLGFLLSVGAMFGSLVAVFQWGWFGVAAAPGPIISFIPIIAIGILFGLAMDYEFFLVSSMHEAYKKVDNPDAAVIDGFGLGSKVVTAAAVIMTAVFAGFITNHDATVQAIGFALSVGVFVDAFIVRMTIVPAVMTLLGKAAWWLPKWLDRIIPHVSIEGDE